MNHDIALTYDDVTLVPAYSDVLSRKDPDTSCSIMGLKLGTPILSANMDTVTGHVMAIAMWKAGGVGVLHRFMDVQRNCEEFQEVKKAGAECMVSIGAKDWWPRAENLYSVGARHFVVDIAHGHSVLVKDVIEKLRKEWGDDVKIMAGNVATPVGVSALKSWGADCVKVGVGGGSVCTTRLVTGFGVPTFSSVLACSKMAHHLGIEIIADGGIRTSGDIVKSLVAGADAVMVGRILAGTDEAPGQEIEEFDPRTMMRTWKKSYKGMSSASARYRAKSTALAEGIDSAVPKLGPVGLVVSDLSAGIRSGMSYGGTKDLAGLRNVQWMRQTAHGAVEASAHLGRER